MSIRSIACIVVCLAAMASARAAAVPDLWTVRQGGLSPAEQLLASTLQGVVNRNQPRMWLETDGMSAVILAQLKSEGTRVHTVTSVWTLLSVFKDDVRGAVVCTLGTPSVNVAASLCGPLSAVAIDGSVLDRAKAGGLAVLHDARGEDSAGCWTASPGLFARGVAGEQAIDKPGHLRDYLVAHNAFIFSDVTSTLRTSIAQSLGPGALVYGWGPDEYRWVRDISRGGGGGVAADWCLNLSAMEHIPAAAIRRPRGKAPAPVQAGQRIVAFSLSDGDNIQWLTGGMPLDAKFYASPLRGTFPFSWEVSPLLASCAPRVLQYMYDHALPGDDFIAMGSPAYSYLHFEPDPARAAAETAPFLKASDLRVVTVLNDNEGSPQEADSLLDLPETLGEVYKDFAPYNRRAGAIRWRNGKPCVALKYLLWDKMAGASPEEVAAAVAQMPASPASDEGSYAIIQAHAWSWGGIGGPLEAVRRTIAALPPGTRVVSVTDLLTLLRNNFGRPVTYAPADAVLALRVAAGLDAPGPGDLLRFDIHSAGPSAGRIDAQDAVAIARLACGADTLR